MKITVVGAGYVGLVTAGCFADLGNEVTSVDSDAKKIKLLKKGKSPFYEPGLEEIVQKNLKSGRLSFTTDLGAAVKRSDVIFIAVGTPPREDGDADLSQIENVALQVARAMDQYKLIVEKSTVPVRTGEKIRQTIRHNARSRIPFDVASNPEFLREGSAVYDFMHPDRVILGVESAKAKRILKEIYQNLSAPLIFTDIKSAEIIKHASNSFLAMKISFINGISRVCELAGADIEEVANGMGLDSRIGRRFLNAGIGFGGFCFPKDLAAFMHISKKLGYDFKLLEAVQEINEEQIARFIKKIEDTLWNVRGKTIAVWGLAFKPNTDDMRFAPSLEIIRALARQGALIRAYDPQAMGKARDLLPDITYCRSAYDAVKKADCLAIVTEWNEFKEIDLLKVKKLLRGNLVIDGRNLYRPAAMKKAGLRYLSVGRASV